MIKRRKGKIIAVQSQFGYFVKELHNILSYKIGEGITHEDMRKEILNGTDVKIIKA